ncbi:MAG TPA: hypothetical protein DCO75_00100 [Fibrobacteres bacterium]|nr:hypothetical protein [Fibrobacterota bacterium]
MQSGIAQGASNLANKYSSQYQDAYKNAKDLISKNYGSSADEATQKQYESANKTAGEQAASAGNKAAASSATGSRMAGSSKALAATQGAAAGQQAAGDTYSNQYNQAANNYSNAAQQMQSNAQQQQQLAQTGNLGSTNAALAASQAAANQVGKVVGSGTSFVSGLMSSDRSTKDILSFDDVKKMVSKGSMHNIKKSLGMEEAPIEPLASQIHGYFYKYKNNYQDGNYGRDSGVHYGPMAQDIEKVPQMAGVVKNGEDGTKVIDTNRLTMANTAALGEISRRLQQMSKKIGA